MKIAHIADTHVRNLKFHKQYQVAFSHLYKILREQKVDYIVHCGDIAHTKTQISPEFIDMASDFFRNLSSIAPTYIILGNHDGNLKNNNRQDAISPIVDALNLPNLHLLKNSGETTIGDNVCLNVLSVFDRDNWQEPTDDSKINIALYHGAIAGVYTDKGYQLEHGEDNLEIFEKFDYAFLGDIHKSNQILDYEGRIRYAGSTIQQNHGETNDKGFLLWDIKDKDKFKVKHYVLNNPSPFVSVVLNKDGTIPKRASVPDGARLRLVAESKLTVSQFQRALEAAKTRFKPENITYISRVSSGSKGSQEESVFSKKDLRDPEVQRELITEYLKEHNLSQDSLGKVFELNDRYNATIAGSTETIARNTNWKIKKMSWSNLFNYGENNSLDFDKLDGIVGIFGKNYSGKSSVIDSLLWIIFGTTSKNDRKNLNVINQNKDSCSGEVKLEVSGKAYTIQRSATKYIKRLKGEETLEAKTEVNFTLYDEVTKENKSLNGLTVSETNTNIRNVFGEAEDFFLTSMSSQLDSLSFIGEGSKKRKEILTRFLDLESFDKKYSAAKSDCSDTKAFIKKLERDNYKEQAEIVTNKLNENELKQESVNSVVVKLTSTIQELDDKISEFEAKISSVPLEQIDPKKEQKNIELLQAKITSASNKSLESKEQIKILEDKISITEDFLKNFDLEELLSKKKEAVELKKKLSSTIAETTLINQKSNSANKKLKLLDEVPCGSEYSHCKFIKDAYSAKTEVASLNQNIALLEQDISLMEKRVAAYEELKVEESIEKYSYISNKVSSLKASLAEEKLSLNNAEKETADILEKIKISSARLFEYENNKDAIENLGNLQAELETTKNKRLLVSEEIKSSNADLMLLNKEKGSLENEVSALLQKERELDNLREEYHTYDLFMQCMHSNGISSDIVRSKLPVINDEIAKILTNVVDFSIIVKNDDKRLDIFIKHPKYDERPVEMGSGAEKTIAAMAIRLALLSVSSLPKADVMILDEPGTALDEENMQGFTTILDLIKSYFKSVILISHLDSLKDCVDTQVNIDKIKGYAKISQ